MVDVQDFPGGFESAFGEYLAGSALVVQGFAPHPVRVLAALGETPAYPCVTIGEDVFSRRDKARDTLFSVTARVHVWVRESGFVGAKRIMGAVAEAALITEPQGSNKPLQMDGWHLVKGFQDLQHFMRDPGDKLSHGIADFNYLFERVA